MTNEKPKRDELMWNIMEEHTRLAELSPGHDLLRYCKPWHEDGILEWSQIYQNEFYKEFGPQEQKKNGYSLMKELLTPKKDKKNGYMTTREIKTNYHNALRETTNKLNGIEE